MWVIQSSVYNMMMIKYSEDVISEWGWLGSAAENKNESVFHNIKKSSALIQQWWGEESYT